MAKMLDAFFLLTIAAMSVAANGIIEPAAPCKIDVYATISLDTAKGKSTLKIDPLMYLGPPAIDIDDSGSIYILNADDNAIEKFDKAAKHCWSIKLQEQILDIRAWGNELFTFNGRKVFVYSLANGTLLDSISIGIKEEDVTAVGNVSKFYGGYLLINKWPVFKKEQLYILDLTHKTISPKIPEGTDLYPIFNCPACSLSFVKGLFENQGYNYLDQSDSLIAYTRSNAKKEILPRVYLLKKATGEKTMANNIPFFKSLSFMSIRCCKFIHAKEMICCAIVRKGYTPKQLKFYKLTF